MGYVGTVRQRDDGKYEAVVKSGRNILYTTHNQGFSNELDAYTVLAHLLTGGPHVLRRADGTFHDDPSEAWTKRRRWPFRTRPYECGVYRNPDGTFDVRITSKLAGRTRVVFTSRRQGYSRERDAWTPLRKLALNGPHRIVGADGNDFAPPSPSRRGLTAAIKRQGGT